MARPRGAEWKIVDPPGEEGGDRRILRLCLRRVKEIPQRGEGGQRPAPGPTTGPRVVGGEPASPRPPRKQVRCTGASRGRRGTRGHSGSLRVPSGKERPLRGETGREHKAMSPAPPGVRGPAHRSRDHSSSNSSSSSSSRCSNSGSSSSRSSGMSPEALAASRDAAEDQGPRKACTVAVAGSLGGLDVRRGLCTHGVQWVPSWPAGAVPTMARDFGPEAQNTGPGPRAAASTVDCAFPHSVQGPGQGASRKPGWERAAVSSTSPEPGLRGSLSIAQRKRKLQAAGQEESPAAPGSVKRAQAVTRDKLQPGLQPPRAGPALQGPATSLGSACAPDAIARGSLVWSRCAELPFWPAVVINVSLSEKTARVLLIEANLCRERSGIRVPLCRLKLLDCEEKEKLLRRASRAFGPSVAWCLSLVGHYRESLARGSFRGSFLEYYAADASYPLRRALREGPGALALRFPEVNYSDLEDSEEEEGEEGEEEEASPRHSQAPGGQGRRKRLLPDRQKAARDRANQKLLDFVVKSKGADTHLLDILQGRKPSRWLEAFLREERYQACVETYLEDDDQLFTLSRYLQRVYERTQDPMPALRAVDKVRLVMEALLPEAVICSIAALEGLDYQAAEGKFLRGPPLRHREKELFDRKIWRETRKRSRASGERLGTPRAPTP